MALRRSIHALGLRYRVDWSPLPGLRRRADIVFGPARVAVFVDGCFWHGCPAHGDRRTHANNEYWQAKLQRNKERDLDTDRRLEEAGWWSLRVWEHEDMPQAALAVADLVATRRGEAVKLG